jgi:hypothetical protein
MNSQSFASFRDELTHMLKEGKGEVGKALKQFIGTAEHSHPSVASVGDPLLHAMPKTIAAGPIPVAKTMADAPGLGEAMHSAVDHAAEGSQASPGLLHRVAAHLHKYEDPYEVGGLGILGGIGADRLQAHARAGRGSTEEQIEHKQIMGESGHAAADTVGLGVLAAPLLAKRMVTGKWTGH